jgi:O-acetyl-ADP-ribose deacetylase (regulator of RNase III)/uncharacterized protein YjbI with pentapeptide repeats
MGARMRDERTGRRRALLVAIERHDDPGLPQVAGPRGHAQSLAHLLEGFEVELLVDAPAAAVLERLQSMALESAPDDELLLYLCGPVLFEIGGRLTLTASDARLDEPGAGMIAAQDIQRALRLAQTRTAAVVIDVSASVGEGSWRPGGVRALVEQLLLPDVAVLTSAEPPSAHALDPGLAPGDRLFSRHVVQGLASGAADLDGDGAITLAELTAYVSDQIRSEQPSKRSAMSLLGSGDFVLVDRRAAMPQRVHLSARGQVGTACARRLGDTLAGALGAIVTTTLHDVSPDDEALRLVDRADVVVALVGPHRELERAELQHALSVLGPGVIPVLLDDAVVPSPSELTAWLQPLVSLQWAQLTTARWDGDVDDLVAAIRAHRPRTGEHEELLFAAVPRDQPYARAVADALGQFGIRVTHSDAAPPSALDRARALVAIAAPGLSRDPQVARLLEAAFGAAKPVIALERDVAGRVELPASVTRWIDARGDDVERVARQIADELAGVRSGVRTADLSDTRVDDHAMEDVLGLLRDGPARLRCDGASLPEGADFSELHLLEASFVEARFRGPVRFDESRIDDAQFTGARFDGADFRGTRFTGRCRFDDAAFLGRVHFEGAIFDQPPVFEGATFRGDISIDGALLPEGPGFEAALYRSKPPFDRLIRVPPPPGPPRLAAAPLDRVATAVGDVLAADWDALVNPISADGHGTGRVGLQILRRAGEEAFPKEMTGRVVVTGAGALGDRRILHTVLEDADGRLTDESIAAGLRAALDVAADELRVHTVALTALGTGASRLPAAETAPVLARTIAAALEDTTLARILLVLADEKTETIFRAQLEHIAVEMRLEHWLGFADEAAGAALTLAAGGTSRVDVRDLWRGVAGVARAGVAALFELADRELRFPAELRTRGPAEFVTPEAGDVLDEGMALAGTELTQESLLGALLMHDDDWSRAFCGAIGQAPETLLDALADPSGSAVEGIVAARRAASARAAVLECAQDAIALGDEVDLIVRLVPADAVEPGAAAVRLPPPADDAELTLLLEATSFEPVEGDDAATLIGPADPVRFRLAAVRPGSSTATVHVFQEGTFVDALALEMHVAEPAAAGEARRPAAIRSRPVALPDVLLEIGSEAAPRGGTTELDFRLTWSNPALGRGEQSARSPSLPAGWSERASALLDQLLRETAFASPLDRRRRLTALGRHLHDQLLPSALAEILREPALTGRTMLLVCDEDAWGPWELLHDGRDFLGARMVIGRWPRELDAARPYEFAIGPVNVAHYEGIERPERWVEMLAAAGTPSPAVLPGGVLGDIAAMGSMQALHMLRAGDRNGVGDQPVRVEDQGGEHVTDVRRARLSLRRVRPLVTLGYVTERHARTSALERTWALAFLRARCSAFAGPLWAVPPDLEAAFTAALYGRLWAGASIGAAFGAARQLVRELQPGGIDWLAWALFADPMARPYRPVPGDGYAIVEAVGRDLDAPVAPGASVRFRASLSRVPPAWHEDRLVEVAEELRFDAPRVHVLAGDVAVQPPSPLTPAPMPGGGYRAWFTLEAPADAGPGPHLVQVSFTDGDRPLHTLMFDLDVTEEAPCVV